MNIITGLDIGGTKSTICLADDKAVIIDRIQFPTAPDRGARTVIAEYILKINDIIYKNKMNLEDVQAVGISCGGPLDAEKGLILSPPNLPGWNQVPVVSMIAQALGKPAFLQNDANACALAEWRYGAGQGSTNMIFLTFGTGLGAGLILNGRLYEGASGMAGEIGHVRIAEEGPAGYGKIGSAEGFCSGGGLAQMAQRELLRLRQLGLKQGMPGSPESIEKVTAQTVCEEAALGRRWALDVLAACGRRLGRTLAILIDLLNPDLIVIGGLFVRAGEFMYKQALDALRIECLEQSLTVCRIVPAALGERLDVLASVSTALEGLDKIGGES